MSNRMVLRSPSTMRPEAGETPTRLAGPTVSLRQQRYQEYATARFRNRNLVRAHGASPSGGNACDALGRKIGLDVKSRCDINPQQREPPTKRIGNFSRRGSRRALQQEP